MNYYKTNEDCFLQPYIALYFTSSIKILYYAKLAIICGDDASKAKHAFTQKLLCSRCFSLF